MEKSPPRVKEEPVRRPPSPKQAPAPAQPPEEERFSLGPPAEITPQPKAELPVEPLETESLKPPASPSLDPAVDVGKLSRKTPSHSSRQGLEEMLRAKPARSEELAQLKAKVTELEAALKVEKTVNEHL